MEYLVRCGDGVSGEVWDRSRFLFFFLADFVRCVSLRELTLLPGELLCLRALPREDEELASIRSNSSSRSSSDSDNVITKGEDGRITSTISTSRSSSSSSSEGLRPEVEGPGIAE